MIQRLKNGRAITLCCTAKSASSATSIASASANGSSGSESIDFGTPKFPMNPIRYTKVPRNTR